MWQSEEADRCRRCGTYPWEWEDDPAAYTWQFHRCPGDSVLDTAEEALSQERRTAASSPNLDRSGWSVVMLPGWAAPADEPDDDD